VVALIVVVAELVGAGISSRRHGAPDPGAFPWSSWSSWSPSSSWSRWVVAELGVLAVLAPAWSRWWRT
jgi:hypothetical protein